MPVFKTFLRDRRGSAVHWFAFGSVALTLCAVAGAKGFDWLAKSGRMPAIAFVRPVENRATAGAEIDTTPTGSVPLAANQIRLRRD